MLTIVLSGAMVILTFTSVIYYRYSDLVKNQIDACSKKIDAFNNRHEALTRIPIVQVEIKTLKGSGFPESAFSLLPTVPSVLSVSHVRGETAKGITIKLSSESEIVQVIPEPSTEESFHKLSDDSHCVSFQINQLRKDSSIHAMIMHKGLGKVTLTKSIDIGKFSNGLNNQPSDDKKLKKLLDQSMLLKISPKFLGNSFDLSDINDLSPDYYSDTMEIEQINYGLKELRRNIAKQPFIYISPNAYLALLGMLMLLCLYELTHATFLDTLIDHKGTYALRNYLLQSDMTIKEAKSLLGKWNRQQYKVIKGDGILDLWIYPPVKKLLFIKGCPGCIIVLSKEKINEVYYFQ